MLQKLLGIKKVDFTDTKTGKEIKGVSIFTSFPSANVTGEETAKIFLDSKIAPPDIDLCVGEEVDVEYGQYGKVIQVTL